MRKTFIILMLSYFALQINATIKATSKQLNFPNGLELIVDKYSIDKELLSYGVCEKPTKQERNCTIFLETIASENNNETYCDITITAETNNTLIHSDSRIVPLDNGKVVFMWFEYNEENKFELIMKFNMINMIDCKETVSNISIEKKNFKSKFKTNKNTKFVLNNVKFMYYDDYYTTIFRNAKFCNSTLCRLVFDQKGNIVEGPVDWILSNANILDVVPIMPRLPSKGHLILQVTDTGAQFSLADVDGLTRIKKLTDTAHFIKFTYTYINEKIGICFKSRYVELVECTIINLDGRTELEHDIKYENQLLYFYPYPLIDGGFLLLSAECSYVDDPECKKGIHNHQIIKINPYGKQSDPLEFKNFNCSLQSSSISKEIYENDNEEYCVNFMCYKFNNELERTTADIIVNCFTDEDFIFSEK